MTEPTSIPVSQIELRGNIIADRMEPAVGELRATIEHLSYDRDEWRQRAMDRCNEAEKWFRMMGVERERADNLQSENAQLAMAVKSEGKVIVDVAGVMDKMTPEFLQFMAPLFTNPMILSLEAEVKRLQDALIYVLDGYGLDGPDYAYTKVDDEYVDEWIINHIRDTLIGKAE